MAGCGQKWKKTDKLFVGSVYQNKQSVKLVCQGNLEIYHQWEAIFSVW